MDNDQITEEKLTIAMVCDAVTDYTAGSLVSTLRFAELLTARGHRIIFIAARSPMSPEDGYYKDTIKVYRFFSVLLPKSEKAFYLSLPTIGKLKKIFAKEKVDLVHVLLPTPSTILSILAAKSMGLKVVSHSHAQPENLFLHIPKAIAFIQKPLNYLFYQYLAWINRNSSVLVYPSEFAQELLAKNIKGIPGHVISNGVNSEVFKKIDVGDFFDKYGIPHGKLNILCVGRLHPEKSVDTYIRALSLVLQKHPHVYAWIVGAGHMDKELADLSIKLGVAEHVSFLGKISDEDLVKAYSAAHIFVLPSLAELEGMVVLEAMACGLPIVIANAPDSASRFFVQSNGFLFEPKNERDLMDKLTTLVENTDLRNKMSKASIEVSKKYNIHESVRRLEAIYHSLLERTHVKAGYVDSRGIYYRMSGARPDRETIVFIHGLSGSSSAWLNYEKAFIERYNVLTFDLRGHGKSKKYPQYKDYEIKEMREDLRQLLQRLRVEKCILVSHSFGTLIAQDFLEHYPEMVSKIIFLSPSFDPGGMLSARIAKPFFSMATTALKYIPWSKKTGTHIDYRKFVNTGDWNVRRMFADVGNTSLHVYLYCTQQSYLGSKADALSRITAPTLLIHGENDTIFPISGSVEMHKRIPNSVFVSVPGTDHVIVLNNFPEVKKAMETFLGYTTDVA